MNNRVLRIKIYQPAAHFRMPFTYQRRHTYPLPPYSTVFGMLINLLGINNQNNDLFKKIIKCKLSVSGRFETKHTEYVWFRNLSKKSHEKYFGSLSIREKNGQIEHIGGQSPIKIDVLENMSVTIHIASSDKPFLNYLFEYLQNPLDRLEVIHLGRAEDWVVFEDISFVELQTTSAHKNYGRFFWIPKDIWIQKNNINFDFGTIEGLLYNLPVFSTIKNYENTFNRNGQRDFKYLRVKLNDGAIRGFDYLSDDEAPVFFADIQKSK